MREPSSRATRPAGATATTAGNGRKASATYVYPIIGALPVQAVDTTLVLKVLEPIWKEKPETASRVRGRIEAVLSWAKVRGYRQGENPALWRGHLDQLLPPKKKVRRVEHHAALPYREIGTLMAKLRADATWVDALSSS